MLFFCSLWSHLRFFSFSLVLRLPGNIFICSFSKFLLNKWYKCKWQSCEQNKLMLFLFCFSIYCYLLRPLWALSILRFSSVQFSCSVVSNSLWPHELQHARPPCPSPTPGVHSDSHPLSQWCHPAISSSVVPISSCPQSLPASESLPMSQLFAWGGQSIGVSASKSVLPMNTQDWSPLGWTGCISLQSKGLSRVFFNTTVQKHQFFGAQLSL